MGQLICESNCLPFLNCHWLILFCPYVALLPLLLSFFLPSSPFLPFPAFLYSCTASSSPTSIWLKPFANCRTRPWQRVYNSSSRSQSYQIHSHLISDTMQARYVFYVCAIEEEGLLTMYLVLYFISRLPTSTIPHVNARALCWSLLKPQNWECKKMYATQT